MSKYFPSQVNADMASNLKYTDLTFDDLMVWRQGWNNARRITPQGYFGDPASFNPGSSRQRMESFVESLANLIESL